MIKFIMKAGIALLLYCYAFTFNTSAQKIAPAALRADFQLLRDTITKIHPSLYRYTSRQQLSHIFDSCYASITDSLDVPQFFALTNFMIAALKDGHANCRMPRELMNTYISNASIFPAMVMFINKKPYVFCCKQNEALTGAEVLSINNQSMDTVMQRLFAYMPTDGNIQSRRDWEMNENFPFLYQIVYGAKDQFEVRYKTSKGKVFTTILKADTFKNFSCPGPFQRPSKFLNLSYKPGNIAVVTVRTFLDQWLQQSGENMQTFLDSAFNDLATKKVQKLIIDVRNNQGGQDVNGALLYSYIALKPFKYYASLESISEKFPETAHPNLKLQYPKPNAYHGQVCFIINGRSFSATAEFAAIAWSNNRGLFVGEETGGGYYGNTSGDEAMVTLPASGLTAKIPLLKYTTAVKKAKYPDRGVIPDRIIYPTIMDVIEKKDPQLENALNGKW